MEDIHGRNTAESPLIIFDYSKDTRLIKEEINKEYFFKEVDRALTDWNPEWSMKALGYKNDGGVRYNDMSEQDKNRVRNMYRPKNEQW